MAVETENLETDLSLAQRFQQLHVRKSRPKFGGLPMNGFKEFLLRGNVIDMAVGIVVGAAFGTVVTSFVNNFISFLLIATAVYFAVVLPINALIAHARKAPPADPTTKKCPECISEIPIQAKRCAFCTSALQA
jgi:large conductance mechanosensitive channel